MRKLKALLVLACAALAMGVISTPASAQTGTTDVEIAGGALPPPNAPPTASCGFRFDWDNHVPASPAGPSQTIDVNNMVTTSLGCGVQVVDGNGTITTDAASVVGVATFEGVIRLQLPSLIECQYEASMTGLWTGDYVDVWTDVLTLDDGSFLCPVAVSSDLRFWGTIS